MVVIDVPERTHEQRLSALSRANEVRVRRAQLKRDLKDQRVTFVDVLSAPPEWADTMRVYDLLRAVPKLGRVKVNKTLRQQRVSPSKTLGGLTVRQRQELLTAPALAPYARSARKALA